MKQSTAKNAQQTTKQVFWRKLYTVAGRHMARLVVLLALPALSAWLIYDTFRSNFDWAAPYRHSLVWGENELPIDHHHAPAANVHMELSLPGGEKSLLLIDPSLCCEDATPYTFHSDDPGDQTDAYHHSAEYILWAHAPLFHAAFVKNFEDHEPRPQIGINAFQIVKSDHEFDHASGGIYGVELVWTREEGASVRGPWLASIKGKGLLGSRLTLYLPKSGLVLLGSGAGASLLQFIEEAELEWATVTAKSGKERAEGDGPVHRRGEGDTKPKSRYRELGTNVTVATLFHGHIYPFACCYDLKEDNKPISGDWTIQFRMTLKAQGERRLRNWVDASSKGQTIDLQRIAAMKVEVEDRQREIETKFSRLIHISTMMIVELY